MLSDWLSKSLDAASASLPSDGRIHGGHYRIEAPGVLRLTPDHVSPHARACVLSAGIHGNETAPIELLGDCLARLEAGFIELGAPVLVILGNLEAIRRNTRFVETNLNRLFRQGLDQPGDEADRARELMAAVDTFFADHPQLSRLHYDLHTAIRDSHYPRFVVAPFADTLTEPQQWRWMAGAGIQAALKQHQHSWTFSHYSKHYHQAQAFTLELGKALPFGHNDLAPLAAMGDLLLALLSGLSPREGQIADLQGFAVEMEVFRESEDFTLCFADNTPNFTEFAPGEVVARDAKAGETRIGATPLSVVFPNAKVELGARAALLVAPVALDMD
ncbi:MULTISPECIES: succinylglutamate desuccinylase [unclassified Halomonas]|uniref:succinylglutamate desuccinylase n=1 Tax=unclassified Halomonas TaxID=2609666 RepID=UPI001C950C90|nr:MULTISPECIES: succinylglutamate desuccinylase [unclassified Halomonas]MBY5923867.1 succinylglutamate desuccinylase [Halomonas sp. DP4Y7-2]MBY6230909.1 succinylglutamate desuccinylase [Halomonas sp. DP4Y7-1]